MGVSAIAVAVAAFANCVTNPADNPPPGAPENWCRAGIYAVDLETLTRSRLALPNPPAETARRGIRYLLRSPDGQQILYGPEFADESDLFLARNDGTDPIRLNPPGIRVSFVTEDGIDASFSPDGRFVAFTGFAPCSQTACARFQVFVARTDGSSVWVVAVSGRNPSWSADGRWIAYEGDFNLGDARSVYVVRRDGLRPPRRLASGSGPVFAPRGNLVAHVCTGIRLCVTSLDGRLRRTLPGNAKGPHPPVWSPDGGRIAYRTQLPTTIRLAWVRSRSTVVLERGPVGGAVTWSPDGRQLVISRQSGDEVQLYARPLDGGPERRLTTEPPFTGISEVRWEEANRLTFAATVSLQR